MAEVMNDGENAEVVRPKITSWRPRLQEEKLFSSVAEVPNWRLADKSRRILSDLCVHYSAQLPAANTLTENDLNATLLRRWGVAAAAAIVVRAAGSGMAMISTGYVPEAGSSLRRAIEAILNARAVLDDTSGDYAARYLGGKSRKLSKLAATYKATDEVELLSQATHANARSLTFNSSGIARGESGVHESQVVLEPARDLDHAEQMLYSFAYEGISMSALLVEAFDNAIELPPWVAGELKRARSTLLERFPPPGDQTSR